LSRTIFVVHKKTEQRRLGSKIWLYWFALRLYCSQLHMRACSCKEPYSLMNFIVKARYLFPMSLEFSFSLCEQWMYEGLAYALGFVHLSFTSLVFIIMNAYYCRPKSWSDLLVRLFNSSSRSYGSSTTRSFDTMLAFTWGCVAIKIVLPVITLAHWISVFCVLFLSLSFLVRLG